MWLAQLQRMRSRCRPWRRLCHCRSTQLALPEFSIINHQAVAVPCFSTDTTSQAAQAVPQRHQPTALAAPTTATTAATATTPASSTAVATDDGSHPEFQALLTRLIMLAMTGAPVSFKDYSPTSEERQVTWQHVVLGPMVRDALESLDNAGPGEHSDDLNAAAVVSLMEALCVCRADDPYTWALLADLVQRSLRRSPDVKPPTRSLDQPRRSHQQQRKRRHPRAPKLQPPQWHVDLLVRAATALGDSQLLMGPGSDGAARVMPALTAAAYRLQPLAGQLNFDEAAGLARTYKWQGKTQHVHYTTHLVRAVGRQLVRLYKQQLCHPKRNKDVQATCIAAAALAMPQQEGAKLLRLWTSAIVHSLASFEAHDLATLARALTQTGASDSLPRSLCAALTPAVVADLTPLEVADVAACISGVHRAAAAAVAVDAAAITLLSDRVTALLKVPPHRNDTTFKDAVAAVVTIVGIGPAWPLPRDAALYRRCSTWLADHVRSLDWEPVWVVLTGLQKHGVQAEQFATAAASRLPAQQSLRAWALPHVARFAVALGAHASQSAAVLAGVDTCMGELQARADSGQLSWAAAPDILPWLLPGDASTHLLATVISQYQRHGSGAPCRYTGSSLATEATFLQTCAVPHSAVAAEAVAGIVGALEGAARRYSARVGADADGTARVGTAVGSLALQVATLAGAAATTAAAAAASDDTVDTGRAAGRLRMSAVRMAQVVVQSADSLSAQSAGTAHTLLALGLLRGTPQWRQARRVSELAASRLHAASRADIPHEGAACQVDCAWALAMVGNSASTTTNSSSVLPLVRLASRHTLRRGGGMPPWQRAECVVKSAWALSTAVGSHLVASDDASVAVGVARDLASAAVDALESGDLDARDVSVLLAMCRAVGLPAVVATSFAELAVAEAPPHPMSAADARRTRWALAGCDESLGALVRQWCDGAAGHDGLYIGSSQWTLGEDNSLVYHE